MIRESYDEIYNGPRRAEPLRTEAPGDGMSVDDAFALGRQLYKEGKASSCFVKWKHKSNAWKAALRKGYAWQKARAKKS